MRISTLVIGAAIAAALAAPAFAQPQGGGGGRGDPAARFAAADTNKDGKVSKEEFKASLPEQVQGRADELFEARDTNKDGFLSPEEMAAGRGGRGGPPPAAN